MKVSYNITQNKFNASLNQETTEIKVSFKTGYYPFPSDLDISNLVPYTGATQDVNIASNYFKTSKGFDYTFDENNYFRSFHLGSLYSQLDFSSNSSEFGYFKIIGNAEIGLNIFQNENYFSIQNNFTVSTKPFLTDSGFIITNGTPNLSLTADGGVFDLNTKADLVGGKVPVSQLPEYTATDVDALKRDGSNANSDINIGEYQLKAGQIELDQTPTRPFGVGMIRWNDTDGTAEIRLKGNNVTLQIGQELVKRVVNKSGANLLESQYKVAKIVGATGQRLSIDLAQANSELSSATTLGMVTENINNNQEGFITYSGEVNGINTTGSLQGETWTDGDILYLSPTVAGGVTKIKPIAPNHVVTIGYVEYAHATQGKIFIKIDNGYELDELHNVNTDISKTTPINADSVLLQDSSDNNIWKKLSWVNVKSSLKTYFDGIYTTTTALDTKLSIETTSITGTEISFTNDKIYGSLASPENGNITANTTNGKLGVTNIIIHNSATAPTFGSQFKKLSGSGNYVTGVVNYIYCTYISNTEIIYSINQRA